MQLETTSPKSKFPHEYSGVIFTQINQCLKKFLKKYKGVPILWNTVYLPKLLSFPVFVTGMHTMYAAQYNAMAWCLFVYHKSVFY